MTVLVQSSILAFAHYSVCIFAMQGKVNKLFRWSLRKGSLNIANSDTHSAFCHANKQTAQDLRNTLPCNFTSGTREMINAHQSIKFLPLYPTDAKKNMLGKALILPCGAYCYICPERSREAGKDEGEDTTVTPSIRDSGLTASVSRPPSSPLHSSLLP